MFEIIKLDPLRRRIVEVFVELEKKLLVDCYQNVLNKEEFQELNKRINYDLLKKEYIDYGDNYYLMQLNDEYIGLFQTRREDREIEILKIYIDEKYRQEGFGYKSFLKILESTQNKRIEKIKICVNENFTKSIDAIEKWGFKFKELTARYLGSNIYLYENCYELLI